MGYTSSSKKVHSSILVASPYSVKENCHFLKETATIPISSKLICSSVIAKNLFTSISVTLRDVAGRTNIFAKNTE